MKLSQAMRLGAMLRPQGKGFVYHPIKKTTCAIGAALEAMGEPIIALSRDCRSYGRAIELWPILALRIEGKDLLALSIEERNLIHLIAWRNDNGWTREQIADWIERIEQKQEASHVVSPQDPEADAVCEVSAASWPDGDGGA